MRTTVRWRPLRDDGIAIDLGTARTQVFVPGQGMVLDEPTLAAYGEGGEVVAAGHDAWVASVVGPARLRMPVRGGVVRDPVGCVHMLRLLLRRAGVATDGRDVAVALPAGADPADASVAAAVIESATGGRVVHVESSLAAVLATDVDTVEGRPRTVCDLGAGVSEIAVLRDGQVLADAARHRGIRSFDDDPVRTVHEVTEAFRAALDALPAQVAADAVVESMLVVGGGALRTDIIARLSDAFAMPLHVPARPRDLVASGLARCLVTSHVAA
jgi:rod shape-determining protein MreB